MVKNSKEHPGNQDIQIPGQYSSTVSASKQPDRLHVFADTSLTAYGVVASICRVSNTSSIMAKYRVAPLKPLTLPKPELMGALTAARLCSLYHKLLLLSTFPFSFGQAAKLPFIGLRDRNLTMPL